MKSGNCLARTALWAMTFGLLALPARAQELTGTGSALIDGVLSPGEWDGAAVIPITLNAPLNDGGGTVPSTLRIMNDGANLYFALEVERPSFGGSTGISLEFDNDNDGMREDGDDILGLNVGVWSPAQFYDVHRYTCPGAPAGSAGCSAFDPSQEGSGAATHSGVSAVLELSHPLNTTDDGHDVSLSAGDVVGFNVFVRLFSLDTACNYGWDCMADTTFPTAWLSYLDFAVQEAPLPPPPTVSIEDVTVVEGDTGSVEKYVVVTLSGPSSSEVTIDYATAAGTAKAGSDFRATSGTLVFAPGEIESVIAIEISGDTQRESDETFSVNLGAGSGYTPGKTSGLVTIVDDDARVPSRFKSRGATAELYVALTDLPPESSGTLFLSVSANDQGAQSEVFLAYGTQVCDSAGACDYQSGFGLIPASHFIVTNGATTLETDTSAGANPEFSRYGTAGGRIQLTWQPNGECGGSWKGTWQMRSGGIVYRQTGAGEYRCAAAQGTVAEIVVPVNSAGTVGSSHGVSSQVERAP